MWVELKGAYGRNYTTAKAVKQDWKDGKDFQDLASGSYTTKDEAEKLGLNVTIRYGKDLTKITGI